MLIRRCAKGGKVYIFKPRTKENSTYKFSEDEIVSFDAQNKSYIVTSDGVVVKRTDSFITAQSSFFDESEDDIKHIEVGKHKIINGIATEV
tara:strand:+ start:1351 stop:1623 length:273 start_codon:yes stop_codon:yes gene_type:complete